MGCDYRFVVASLELVVDVKVQADEENDSDEERDKGQENELLEQSGFLKLDSELVLFLGQLVTFSLEKSVANILHDY